MNVIRRLALALALALALVVGQQAAALHELAHASGEYAPKHGSKTGGCETHYLYSQLGSTASAAKAVPPLVAFTPPGSAFHAWRIASLAPRFAFQSRAPPLLG